MKWIVKISLGLIALVIVVFAGAVIMLATVDPNSYKDRIAATVQEKSGRNLTLAGNIKVMYFPVLGFEAADLHLGNPAGFPDKDFLSVEQVEAGIKIVPLFQHKIELTTIRLLKPQIAVIKKADGHTNLEFGSVSGSKEVSSNNAPTGPAMQFSAGKIEISDAIVNYTDEGSGKTTRVDPLNLTLPGFTGNQPEDFSLDAVFKAGAPETTTNLGIKGRLTANPDNGTFNITGLKSDMAVASASMPEVTKISLTGNAAIDTRSQKIIISDLQATAKGTSIKGQASITSFSKPDVTFDLSAPSVDVSALMPGNKNEEKTGAKGENNNGANQELLPVDLLQKLGLNGNITIGVLKVAGLELADVNIKVTARDGLVSADPVSINLYKGSLTSQMKIDARATPPALSLAGALKGMEISDLLKDMTGEDYVAGLTNATFSLSSHGNTVHALEDSAGGNVKVDFGKGYINKWQLSKRMNQAIAFFQTGSIPANASDKIYFTSLNATIAGENGIFSNSDLQFIGPKTHALGNGSVNLRSQTVDYNVLVGLGDDPSGFKTAKHLPIRITGPLSAPGYSLDVQAMVKAAAGQKIEAVKQQMLGKMLDKQKPAAGTADQGFSGGKNGLLNGILGH
jgi:AsmA protein